MSVQFDLGHDLRSAGDSKGMRLNRGMLVRPVAAIAIAVVEMLTISVLFSFEVAIPYWQHPAYWMRQLLMAVLVGAVAWAIISFRRRDELLELLASIDQRAGWRGSLATNLGLFALLTCATVAFTLYASSAAEPPWGWFWLYCLPLGATALSLLTLFAPVTFWKTLLRRHAGEIALALFIGVAVMAAGGLAQTAWEQLAGITLGWSYRVLALYESSISVDYDTKLLIVGDFGVIIDQSCSGYEGMALVTAFLALYLWIFRASLKFPNALLLFPIGIAAIFALNIARIVALVSIGAHVSPEIAAGGFHSQAGWLAFLAVTLGLMVGAPRLAFFSRQARVPVRVADTGNRVMEALLVPFMALMAGSIVASASAPYDTWLYGVKIAAAGLVLIAMGKWYRPFIEQPSSVALAVGFCVGAIWVATDPGQASSSGVDLGSWLAAQPIELAVLWLIIRAIGGIVIVPIVEELAFRGLLYRWIISRRFEDVAFDRFSWSALLISSLLFGLMHSRPVAGTLAGIVLALVMVRSGRLADAIGAHMAANAVIVVWAIAMAQWTLL